MLPELVLDSDSFEDLIEEYRSQIAEIYPDWTDYNYHDPGITFLELFSWMQENQQFFMEQLGEAHYRQFFRMAGVQPLSRRPARVLAAARDRLPEKEIVIPAGTVFMSGGLPFETLREELIPAAQIVRIDRRDPSGKTEFLADTDPAGDIRGLSFPAFGTLPRQGSTLNLKLEGRLNAGKPFHLSVGLEEKGRNPAKTGSAVCLAKIDWEYRAGGEWKPLEIIEDGTFGLLYSGRIALRSPEDLVPDGDEPQIRAVFRSGDFDEAPVIREIGLGEIELIQLRIRRFPEGELIAEGNGFPDQEYALPSASFLGGSVGIRAEDILSPGRTVPWKRIGDLLDAGPEDRCFTADEQTGTIRFGDGFHGLPPEGRILLTSYAETAGMNGNVKERSVFTAEDARLRAAGVPSFRMTRRISLGRDPEKQEDTLLRIVRERRRISRAVTLKDYEEIACAAPGLVIHSAHAWTGEQDPNTVHIAVRPGSGRQPLPLSGAFRDAVLKHLEEYRLLGVKLRLHSPEYIRVDVSCEVVPSSRYHDCEDVIRREIGKFFEEMDRRYGEPLELSALYGRLDRLACIRRIVLLQLDPARPGIRRNRNGDLLPPPAGIFLSGKTEISLNYYGD